MPQSHRKRELPASTTLSPRLRGDDAAVYIVDGAMHECCVIVIPAKAEIQRVCTAGTPMRNDAIAALRHKRR